MAFAFPDLLDGDWKTMLAHYRAILEPVPGMITMHGPFMDMAPGSPDRLVNQACMERYQHAIRIGQQLGCEIIVFHANFIAAIQTDAYRKGWQRRNIAFWTQMADYAAQHNVTLAVENMWEFDPDIIGDVLKTIEHPNLRACVDVGHAHLFSKIPFPEWLSTLSEYLVHFHMNNNDGLQDIHRALPDGVLDYRALLPELRAMPNHPTMTLEMETVDDMKRSLPYLTLPESSTVWRCCIPSE
jgi:sugar phosphate isomerase/epimerase